MSNLKPTEGMLPTLPRSILGMAKALINIDTNPEHPTELLFKSVPTDM